MIDIHCHVFNKYDVPQDFLYVRLSYKEKFLSRLSKLLDKINPFSEKDIGSSVSNFVDILNKDNSFLVFEELKKLYPEGTLFCPLSMDLRNLSKEPMITRPYIDQLKELSLLTKNNPEIVYPFLCCDPNSPDMLDNFREFIVLGNFKGIKIYPSLGYLPSDSRLDFIFSTCEKNNLPVTAHCSLGAGVEKHGGEYTDYNHPRHWEPVLKKYPNLKINLAHFGGGREGDAKATIISLMEKYPNVYTDTSFEQVKKKNLATLYRYYTVYPILKERLLYGSDFYMSHLLKDFKDTHLSIKEIFGEDFKTISEVNPKKFLGIKD